MGSSKDNWVEVTTPNFRIVSNSGEGQARKLAVQFEQFREMFHNAFPQFRVDLGKPLVILAVKNEDSLKILLPAYWETRGRIHPAGYFMPGEAQHFVAVRTDIEGDNPYEVVYHEYTHAIMNLNVQGLPVWLSEGLAEYFGASVMHEKEVDIGRPLLDRLMELQQSRLIPIDALMLADAHSPYYNEENRASVFYAESWAIVHYLMLDPEAHKRQLLHTFLAAWDSSGNQLQAAEQTFGDLKKFANSMAAYVRQPRFFYTKVPTSAHADAKSFSVRAISPAEAAAQESLFLVQTGRMKEAASMANEAVGADPNLAAAHQAQGEVAYRNLDFQTAQKEFTRSIELDSKSYISYYYAAEARLRGGDTSYQDLPEISAYLEKVLTINGGFAPAYSALCTLYSMHRETYEKALASGRKAIDLEPGNLFYATTYGYALLNMGHTADAKTLAGRIAALARNPQEQQMAAQLTAAAVARETALQWRPAPETQEPQVSPAPAEKTIELDGNTERASNAPGSDSKETAGGAPPSGNPPPLIYRGPEYHLEGKVVAAECLPNGEVKVALSINSVLMKFHASDIKSVELTSAGKSAPADKPACAAWKGQKAKVGFHSAAPGGEYDGELSNLYFF
jgi:tetratricopeptide (TPR) repeat protein